MKKSICLLIIILTILSIPVAAFAMDHYDPDSIEPGVIITAAYNNMN